MQPDELVEIGHILRPFGIQGEVKVRPVGEPEQLLSGVSEVYLVQGDRTRGPIALERARTHGTAVVVKLAGYDTPESTEGLRQARLSVPYGMLPRLPDGEFYFCELLGSRVELSSGQPLGIVDGYVPMEDHDLLVVRDGDHERLIPTQEAVLLSFDKQDRRLVVAWDPEAAADAD